MKLLTFPDSIVNKPKLKRDLNDLYPDVEFGLYNTAGLMYVNASRSLNQAEIDGVNGVINNFVEQSALDDAVNILRSETEQGFDLYRQIVADINLNGGLNASVDESIRLYTGKADVSTMVISMEDIRCMLKDNFVEFALRCLHKFLDPDIGFSTEQLERYSNWFSHAIRKRMELQGASTPVIDGTIAAIIGQPKGQI